MRLCGQLSMINASRRSSTPIVWSRRRTGIRLVTRSGGTTVPLAVDTAMKLGPLVPATAYPPFCSSTPSEVSIAAPESSRLRRGADTCESSAAVACVSLSMRLPRLNTGMPNEPAKLTVSFGDKWLGIMAKLCSSTARSSTS